MKRIAATVPVIAVHHGVLLSQSSHGRKHFFLGFFGKGTPSVSGRSLRSWSSQYSSPLQLCRHYVIAPSRFEILPVICGAGWGLFTFSTLAVCAGPLDTQWLVAWGQLRSLARCQASHIRSPWLGIGPLAFSDHAVVLSNWGVLACWRFLRGGRFQMLQLVLSNKSNLICSLVQNSILLVIVVNQC